MLPGFRVIEGARIVISCDSSKWMSPTGRFRYSVRGGR